MDAVLQIIFFLQKTAGSGRAGGFFYKDTLVLVIARLAFTNS
jgi:hypothetical protein